MTLRRVDLFAAASALLTFAVLVAYLRVVSSQGEPPAVWVVAVLVAAGSGAAYSTGTSVPGRRRVLWPCAVALLLLGVVALLSIGLPILLAGTSCLVAAVRACDRVSGEPVAPDGP